MKRSVTQLRWLLAVALAAGLLLSSGFTCNKTGDTTLSSLVLEVAGVDQMTTFDPAVRTYDLLFPNDTMTVRVQATDPGAQLNTNYLGQGAFLGIGSGEATFAVPPDYSLLRIYVKAPGLAVGFYDIRIIRTSDPSVCGSNDHCSADEGCVGIDPVSCFAGGVGSCEAVPVSCPSIVDLVCGCDGVTYTNDCNLLQARVRPSAVGACECNINADCSPTEYCNAFTCDGPGTCTVMPTVCDPGPGDVVGCNQLTYDSVCDAASSGIRVAGEIYVPPVPFDPPPQTLAITVACTDNLFRDVSILPWELTADPGVIIDGDPVTIDYTGVALFPEWTLDAGLACCPGIDSVELQQGNRGGATIVPKAGLTGGDAAGLEIDLASIPLTCDGGMNDGASCTVDSDCLPIGYFLCTEVVPLPIIDGTGDACAACDALGPPKNTQCADNGYCVSGPLALPLQNITGNYAAAVANPDGVLLGWDETNQGGVNADGTYILNPASFGAPWQPGGLRVVVDVLQIALNCVMAVDSDGPDGVGVPGQASPTPSSALMQFPVHIP